jgi:hypothetical protein
VDYRLCPTVFAAKDDTQADIMLRTEALYCAPRSLWISAFGPYQHRDQASFSLDAYNGHTCAAGESVYHLTSIMHR